MKLTDKGASSQAIQDALYTIEAKAQFRSPEFPIYTRTAFCGDGIVIDLCDSKWQCVQVDADGWGVVDESPVKFVRPTTSQALPVPKPGGNINDLKKFLNIEDDDFKLIVGWLLMGLRGRGDFPVLVVHGEQGSAKSTLTQILRSLVDPSSVPLRGMWRTEDDLLVSASKSWCVVIDNLSYLSREMSDAICRLATGGGHSKRKLYSDDEEYAINLMRPVMMNGIEAIATQPDLLSRSLVINLPIIEDGKAKEKEIVLNEFESMRAKLFGALLDALSHALKRYRQMKVRRLPRMTSFAIWVTAAESSIGWESGAFMEAYRKNLHTGAALSIDASTVGEALQTFIAQEKHWKGTTTELLKILGDKVTVDQLRDKTWPKAPHILSRQLKRLAPSFRKIGVNINLEHSTKRWVQIDKDCI